MNFVPDFTTDALSSIGRLAAEFSTYFSADFAVDLLNDFLVNFVANMTIPSADSCFQ